MSTYFDTKDFSSFTVNAIETKRWLYAEVAHMKIIGQPNADQVFSMPVGSVHTFFTRPYSKSPVVVRVPIDYYAHVLGFWDKPNMKSPA